jgi:5-methylcytosine-specific restriction endonuclease McrA
MRTKEEIRKKQLEYYHKNKDRIKKYKDSKKEETKTYNREYWKNNRQRIQENKKTFFQNNPEANMTQKQRIQVQKQISRGIRFIISTIKYLGCTFNEYSEYLENQFDGDMSWENYGGYWEIDHIIPLSKGGSFHYTNTQPLVIEKNRKKGNSLEK